MHGWYPGAGPRSIDSVALCKIWRASPEAGAKWLEVDTVGWLATRQRRVADLHTVICRILNRSSTVN